MSVVNFKIAGVKTKAVDATSNFTTDAIAFVKDHTWSVSFNTTGLVGGPPTYTIQVSNNGTNWNDWDLLSTNLDIAIPFDDDHISFRFMRIVYLANAASAGTFDLELGIFNNINR